MQTPMQTRTFHSKAKFRRMQFEFADLRILRDALGLLIKQTTDQGLSGEAMKLYSEFSSVINYVEKE